MDAVQKVTAFITRQQHGVSELLVFRHPLAGIQLPAGTVEPDESLEDAVIREVFEETGLQAVKIEREIGRIDNELSPDERIISTTTRVYLEPNTASTPYQKQLSRGITVNYLGEQDSFVHAAYLEYDQYPVPQFVTLNITGWIPQAHVATCKERVFYHLVTTAETPDSWELRSDSDHIFKPFWTPLTPDIPLIVGQKVWLDSVFPRL